MDGKCPASSGMRVWMVRKGRESERCVDAHPTSLHMMLAPVCAHEL